MINEIKTASVMEAQNLGEQISTSTNEGATSIDNGATSTKGAENNVATDSIVSTTQSRFGSNLNQANLPEMAVVPTKGYRYWNKCSNCQEQCKVKPALFPTFMPPRIYHNLWHRHAEVCPLEYEEICNLYAPHVCNMPEDVGAWEYPEYAEIYAYLKEGIYPPIFQNVKRVYDYHSEYGHLEFGDVYNEIYPEIYYDLKEQKVINPDEDSYPSEGLTPKTNEDVF